MARERRRGSPFHRYIPFAAVYARRFGKVFGILICALWMDRRISSPPFIYFCCINAGPPGIEPGQTTGPISGGTRPLNTDPSCRFITGLILPRPVRLLEPPQPPGAKRERCKPHVHSSNRKLQSRCCLSASVTSRRESFGFQRRAAGTLKEGLRCVTGIFGRFC